MARNSPPDIHDLDEENPCGSQSCIELRPSYWLELANGSLKVCHLNSGSAALWLNASLSRRGLEDGNARATRTLY